MHGGLQLAVVGVLQHRGVRGFAAVSDDRLLHGKRLIPDSRRDGAAAQQPPHLLRAAVH